MATPQCFQFELRYFPLVLVTCPVSPNEANVREMFARLHDVRQKCMRHGIVMDTRPVREVADAKLRKVLVDLTKASADDTRRWCVSTAVVVESALVRGAMTAIAWVFPPPTPTLTVATLREGVDWCCAKLEAEGIQLSADTALYRERAA
jgi:hypothetical protein